GPAAAYRRGAPGPVLSGPGPGQYAPGWWGNSAPRPERREDLMPAKAKTLLIWIVVIFLIFAIVNDPDRAGNIVTSIWDFIANTISSFVQFFSTIAS
ncbi:hypothetical protein, partial [Isoptericola sp. NPDC060185]|uniref:hypothetical protein n=2 Tax=Isoptericola TaxID=254250 RepID=UPI003657D9E6